MTQQTAPWANWHLERSVELLRTFGLVRWGLGGSGHVEAKSFLDCPVSVIPHKSLNSRRGVISEPDLLTTTHAEILGGFSGQGVIQSLQLLNLQHQLRQNSGWTSVTVASPSKSHPPTFVIDTAPTTSNSSSISAASSSSTACSVLE
ncbi:hypothetical protein TNCV_2383511 [Trichonephila clavipes]|nr:hypothetical protein TNCV_2383511 [Trichonephila clavipes]